MMEAALVGAADIHSRTAADCFAGTENLDIFGTVLIINRLGRFNGSGGLFAWHG